ncbi:MAG: Co2+/Mg2+ efflux protein ApaG [Phycisphaerales bacterium]|nr:Co2+/Mg2+ efflux protein ApaG [Phycisphaerales bacterium]
MPSLTPTSPVAPSKHASDSTTEGVRIQVEPSYLASKSKPALGRWIFGYRVTITNESDALVQIIARRWSIVDADGDVETVVGEGIVGQQPLLRCGESFEYSSFAPLETPWGTMEGSFTMSRKDGTTFDARIARFYLVST